MLSKRLSMANVSGGGSVGGDCERSGRRLIAGEEDGEDEERRL